MMIFLSDLLEFEHRLFQEMFSALMSHIQPSIPKIFILINSFINDTVRFEERRNICLDKF